MEAAATNVAPFSNRIMYKRILKKADIEFGFEGSIENTYLLTENSQLCVTGVLLDHKFSLSTEDEGYDHFYVSGNTYLYYEDIDKIVVIDATRYDENYSHIEEVRSQWESTKNDGVFSRILDVQVWDDCPLLNDLRIYLDLLYDKGFRLVRSDKVSNNIKSFYVNFKDVIVNIRIDYNAITSVAEESAMSYPETIER